MCRTLTHIKGYSPMTKQVAKTPPKAEIPAEGAKKEETKTLYVKVETYSAEGKQVGERVVDMYHFGTRNWLQNHQWWAMHNANTVELRVADAGEVQAYIDEQRLQLAEKFNREHQEPAAA